MLSTSTLFAQKISLQLIGLDAPKAPTSISLNSASLDKVELQNPRTQGGTSTAFIISRNQDNLSAKIITAISTGKMIESAVIQVVLANGTTLTHNLSGVLLSDYRCKTVNGKDATEQFYIQFNKNTVEQK